ncbi:MAG: antibiotic biosynthesis monooxygenase [Crocosphaera sp.]|nr:antibiotic biosynthesis monooxygenase [Crocosphaera sp.]
MERQTNTDDNPPVTVTVKRIVKPGCEKEFEEFLIGIINASMTFEGHLGTNVFPPTDPTHREYLIVFKFNTRSNLERWERSKCRRQWFARGESLTVGSPIIEVITGLETWFTLSRNKPIIPPPRYKMAVITWLAIFPLVNLINLILAPILSNLPSPQRTLILTVILVHLMTYIVMPRMTRIFAFWLYSKATKNN